MNNTFEYALRTFHEYQMLGVWTCLPCKIVSDFVVEEMRVDVQPIINMIYKDGTVEQRPPILSVPVMMPATKSSLVYIPVQKGDIVLCMFSQRALDNFKSGDGDFQEPSDFRLFDKRDAIALPGLFPFSQAPTAKRTIPDDPLSLSITNNVGEQNEVTLQLRPDGTINIKTPSKITVEAPMTLWEGDINQTGSFSTTGNISAGTGPSTMMITPLGQVVTVAGGQIANVADGIPSAINLDYYAELENSIDNIQDCASLQAKTTEIVEKFNQETAAIHDTLDKLAPITALLSPPTSPEDIITWVTDFIDAVLTPLTLPTTTLPAQLTARATAMTAVLAKIADKQSQFDSCSVTPPPVDP